MWKNTKYYVIALAIIYAGAIVSTGFQLLEAEFPNIHPLSKLAANLSGVSVGGFIMVLGFLRDSRLDDERKRTDLERERADRAISRAERAEAELERLRAQFQPAAVLDRIQRLEEINGIANANRADADGADQANRGE